MSPSIWQILIVLLFAVAYVVPFWKILGRIGYPKWLAIFAIIPLVSIILLWVVAFSKWSGDKTREVK